MVTKDQENEAILEKVKQREAGVIDLFEFYADIEAVYAASLKAFEEGNNDMVTNSTNAK